MLGIRGMTFGAPHYFHLLARKWGDKGGRADGFSLSTRGSWESYHMSVNKFKLTKGEYSLLLCLDRSRGFKSGETLGLHISGDGGTNDRARGRTWQNSRLEMHKNKPFLSLHGLHRLISSIRAGIVTGTGFYFCPNSRGLYEVAWEEKRTLWIENILIFS